MTTVSSYRLTVKDEAVVVTAQDDGAESVFTFDRAGRFFAAWLGQRLYRRALSGRMVEKWTDRRSPDHVVHRRTLDSREADLLLDRAAEAAARTAVALGRGEVELVWSAAGPVSEAEAERLVRAAAAFDRHVARRDARRYAEVYRPVGILPPDQYLALVIQLTEGCHWNRCTFCTFYRDQPFRVKPLPELESHVREVTAYLGEGLTLRRSLFLGEANALCLPTDDLIARLALIHRWFDADGAFPRGMYAFLDVFTGRRKSAEEFAELRVRGLRRVYVGLESGDGDLLRFLNKPQRPEHAVELVRALKAAGLSVGVIVMAGVGGDRFADAHVAGTLGVLNALPLDAGDLVYLSAFVEYPHSDYERAAREAGLRPLGPHEIRNQIRLLREGVRRGPDGPRVARYDIAEFIY
ncbi:MAG: radical SAM protein [Armatimonadota bacterium]|nr:radical SAM protein [Armatimonadota bacterium]MDR7451458.1 radical SAM protein [Armatimonadota bacterium]MDR7466392.1 radical SAM protein [Armatimonadota bacterium]MDR7493114.1 radical SAM protein [Armatimonadota bacterium]MDR7498129.1 radical SAM protein [Armatimonadota bacterium]